MSGTYRDFNSVPLTNGDSIEKGSIGVEHLDAATYLQFQQIKLHTHSGVDSLQLKAIATPEVLKALGPQMREEHGNTSGAGSVTFNTPFQAVPVVIVGPLSASAVYASGVSTTGFTANGGALSWIAIGR